MLFDDSKNELLRIGSPITAAPFTIAAWTYADASIAAAGTAVSITDISTADDHYWMLYINATESAIFRAFVATASNSIGGTSVINEWHHFAGQEVSATSRFVFLDGTKASEATGSRTPLNIDTFAIAGLSDSTPTWFFSGHIVMICLWQHTSTSDILSEGQVQMLADGKHPFRVRREQIVGFVTLMDEEAVVMESQTRMNPNVAITVAVEAAGTATLTAAGHTMASGQKIRVKGVTPVAYNGDYDITSISGDDILYALAGSPDDGTAFGTVAKNFPILSGGVGFPPGIMHSPMRRGRQRNRSRGAA